MRKLGISSDSGGSRGERTRLRNQMDRLFSATLQFIYEDRGPDDSTQVKDTFTSPVARKTHLVWNPRRPNEPVLWESKVELGWDFFQEIIRCPVPLDMNILKALSRSSLGLDLYLWTAYRTFTLTRPLRLSLSAGVEEDQGGLAGLELRDGQGGVDPLAFDALRPSGTATSTHEIALKTTFPAQRSLLTALPVPPI